LCDRLAVVSAATSGASARFGNGQVIQGQCCYSGIHTACSDPLDGLTRTLADGHTFNGYTLKDLNGTIPSFAGASVVAAARGDRDGVVRFARRIHDSPTRAIGRGNRSECLTSLGPKPILLLATGPL
jgi:hypothetical protein